MRVWLVLLLAQQAACGRFGFEAHDNGMSDDTDATIDTACVPAQVCDPVAVTGCCGGTTCFSNISANSLVCLAPGVARENEHCAMPNDCVAGTTCADDGGWVSCRRVCAITTDCTNGPGSRCSYAAGPARVCSQGCEPFLDTGCPSDGGCRILRDSFGAFITECKFAGTKTQGMGCANDPECDGGYSCVGNICRKICRVGGADCINPFPNCGGNVPQAIIGGIEYGTCDP